MCSEGAFECIYGRIDGQEPPYVSTDEQCDGITDCIGGEDELDHNCPCGPEGAVRLVDGFVPYRGTVEFCLGGIWRSICSESWDDNDATVVCRQLGYHSGNHSPLLHVHMSLTFC